ncbi:MAG: polyribonucleotide nucleotidyltransferase, partial [Chloroflexi bacterium]|nr:polyribonucleotide nucleotidyltransferase [Chloroflexota bacterium]
MPVTRAHAIINGETVTFETGKFATQAGGSATVRIGDTMVFSAATMAKPRAGIDFFPLTIEFEERLYAAGKIPGSFPRREGRPSEEGILTARLVDRPIRPLWPKGFKNEIQVVVSPWSTDQEQDYQTLAVNAASTALTLSNAPFEGPIGCVRVGTVGGKLTLNPKISQMADSELDFVVAGTKDSIMMVEAGAKQVSEETLIQALALAQDGIAALCKAQEDL